MTDSIADKLDEARALIEKGWTRGEFKRRGCYCALGALGMACVGDPRADNIFDPTYTAAVRLLGVVLDRPNDYQIASWNDRQPSRKPVIEAFRKAAELARQEQVQ